MVFFSNSLNNRVCKIQNKLEYADKLICEYKHFIISTAKKFTGKNYITESDDEYSIALIAFSEAIKSYDYDKGNFLSFAKNIIKNRLIDYYRKEKRHINILPIDNNDEDDGDVDLTYKQSLSAYEESEISEKKRLEFAQFKDELAEWDISLLDLVQASPKHIKTKEICKIVINYLLSDEEKIKHIFKKHTIPLLEIQKDTGLPRKILERFRKYIVSVLIIKNGDYQFLNDYVTDWRCEK